MKRTAILLLVAGLLAIGSLAVGVAVGRVNPRMTADGQPPPPPKPPVPPCCVTA